MLINQLLYLTWVASEGEDCQLNQVAKGQARCLLEGTQHQATDERLQIPVALGCSVPRDSPELCRSRGSSRVAGYSFYTQKEVGIA